MANRTRQFECVECGRIIETRDARQLKVTKHNNEVCKECYRELSDRSSEAIRNDLKGRSEEVKQGLMDETRQTTQKEFQSVELKNPIEVGFKIAIGFLLFYVAIIGVFILLAILFGIGGSIATMS